MKRLVFLMFLFGLITALPAAAQDEKRVYATAQRYDSGLMIWRSDTGTIWVLADDGRALDFPTSTYASSKPEPLQ